MGAQQGKDVRSGGSGFTNPQINSGNCAVLNNTPVNSNAFGAGTSIRASRMKSRQTKDAKTVGSNIFTEHNGEFFFCFLFFSCFLFRLLFDNLFYDKFQFKEETKQNKRNM